MIDPQPVPDGLDANGLIAMSVDDGEWRKNEEFACRECGEPAFLNPYSNQIWGCKCCGFTTQSPKYFFWSLLGLDSLPAI